MRLGRLDGEMVNDTHREEARFSLSPARIQHSDTRLQPLGASGLEADQLNDSSQNWQYESGTLALLATRGSSSHSRFILDRNHVLSV